MLLLGAHYETDFSLSYYHAGAKGSDTIFQAQDNFTTALILDRR